VTRGEVERWLRAGLMGKIPREIGAGYRVTQKNVTSFLRSHSSAYDLRRVDQAWFKRLWLRGEMD